MQTGKITKYTPFDPIDLPERQWPNRTISRAPIWTSVDLRDGNQALSIPMDVDEKLDMFELLVGIEKINGFPQRAIQLIMRRLVDENLSLKM